MHITLEHPFCSERDQVARICKPLFANTPFRYFDYQRHYYDGNYLGVCLDSELAIEAMKREIIPSLEELQHNSAHYICYSASQAIPEMLSDNEKFVENINLTKEFKIYHRLYLAFKTSEYIEGFGFGLNRAIINVLNTFLNYTPWLENFCVYFREAARNILERVEDAKIKIYDSLDAALFCDLNFKNNSAYTDFLKELNLKKYQMKGKDGPCTLSKREFECLLWGIKNKTAKQIAKILSLSPRTIETYFETLKNKMGCESKLELMDIAYKNPLIKSYIE